MAEYYFRFVTIAGDVYFTAEHCDDVYDAIQLSRRIMLGDEPKTVRAGKRVPDTRAFGSGDYAPTRLSFSDTRLVVLQPAHVVSVEISEEPWP